MTGREKRLAGVTAGIALAALVYVYAAEPLYSAWRDTRDELAAARRQYESSSNLLALRNRIEKAIGERLPPGQPVESIEEETASLFKTVEALAAKAGLRIREMRPGAVRDRPYGRESEITLAGEGNTKALASFLLQLETAPCLLCVGRMEITAGSKPSEIRVTLGLVRVLPTPGV